MKPKGPKQAAIDPVELVKEIKSRPVENLPGDLAAAEIEMAAMQDEIDRLNAALEEVTQDRDKWRSMELGPCEQIRAAEQAEAAIVADLREGANLLDGGMVLRMPWSDFATHNRAIASALRKAANRYERGDHRKGGGDGE
jgi:hypothetical protein